jgi:hypothetical protein
MRDDPQPALVDRINTYGSVIASELGRGTADRALAFSVCSCSDASLKPTCWPHHGWDDHNTRYRGPDLVTSDPWDLCPRSPIAL